MITYRSALFAAATCLICTAGSQGEEFWAEVEDNVKGSDYLWIVDTAKATEPGTRLRCEAALPVYVAEMSKAASRVKAKLYLRVRCKLRSGVNDQSAGELKVLLVCLVPKESVRNLGTLLNDWKGFAPIEEEPLADPFLE